SNRNIFRGALFETTVQYANRHDSDLAKGSQTLIVTPLGWSGNYFADRWSRSNRLHATQTMSLERPLRGMTHQIKIGAEAEDISSQLPLTERPFEIRDAANTLQQIIQFDGPNSATSHNYLAGVFLQDRVIFSPKLQIELGVRGDHESIANGLDI